MVCWYVPAVGMNTVLVFMTTVRRCVSRPPSLHLHPACWRTAGYPLMTVHFVIAQGGHEVPAGDPAHGSDTGECRSPLQLEMHARMMTCCTLLIKPAPMCWLHLLGETCSKTQSPGCNDACHGQVLCACFWAYVVYFSIAALPRVMPW